MSDIRILNTQHTKGRISHALFDFDGTLSLIRYGWEEVMQELMEEMITGDAGEISPELSKEVARYIDESTGVLTISQMRWLAEAVKRWKLTEKILDAGEYKRIYNQRLLSTKVNDRLASYPMGGIKEDLLLSGSFDFIKALFSNGVMLYLASGTDDVYVQREAAYLGIKRFFSGKVYGALDDTEEYSKENIIRRILESEIGRGKDEMLVVFGDGPVEIRAAKEYGALAVGVASDEGKGRGWNEKKVRRLSQAGADILIPDFAENGDLITLIEK